MKVPSLQFTVARGASLAGAAVAMLLPLLYVGSSLPVVHVDHETVALTRYLLATWALPAAVSMMVGGYLLQPTQGRLPRTRLFGITRIGVTVLLWVVGMLCLLAPILIALFQATRFVDGGSTLPPWQATVFTTYVLYFAFFPAGILLLLGARKWIIETGMDV